MKEKTQQNIFMNRVRVSGGMIIKTHGDNFSSGQPDLIGALRGVVFAVEWKKSEKESPSPLQWSILAQWNANGMITAIHYDANAAWQWLQEHIEQKRLRERTISHSNSKRSNRPELSGDQQEKQTMDT